MAPSRRKDQVTILLTSSGPPQNFCEPDQDTHAVASAAKKNQLLEKTPPSIVERPAAIQLAGEKPKGSTKPVSTPKQKKLPVKHVSGNSKVKALIGSSKNKRKTNPEGDPKCKPTEISTTAHMKDKVVAVTALPRSKPAVTTTKEVTNKNGNVFQTSKWFLLPAEIRNAIYSYVFPARDFEIKWLVRRQSLTYWQYRQPRLTINQTTNWGQKTVQKYRGWSVIFQKPALRPDAHSTRRARNHVYRSADHHTKLPYPHRPSQTALLLVSREIHAEACSMFYSSSSFGFASMTLLRHFTSKINPIALTSIRRIFIYHSTYGEPYQTAHVSWKALHDDRWDALCVYLAKSLVGLQELGVLLRINDCPLEFNLTAAWARPLMHFQRRGLQRCGVALLVGEENSRYDTQLGSCAEVVRRGLLGDRYSEDFAKKGGVLKAKKCLVIR